MRSCGVAIALLFFASGCSLNVGEGATLFACDASGACPADHVCVDQFCVPDADAPSCTKVIAAGVHHSCAIRTDGTAWCWGRNDSGQLGDGTTDDRDAPVMVQAPHGTTFTAIVGGLDHTCAIDTAKQVWCWGSNSATQLGNAKIGGASNTPVMVPGVKGATQIVSGDAHTCVLTETGMVCWGSNSLGQIGNHSNSLACLPVEPLLAAAGAGPVTAIGASANTTCAADAQKMWCWGANNSGQFGNGAQDTSSTTKHPDPVASNFANVTRIAVGTSSTCVIDTSQAIWCAGSGTRGQLGTGASTSSTSPVAVPFAGPATAIAVGGAFACATDEQARAWCWGGDDLNQLASAAIDVDQGAPVVSDFKAVQALVAGSAHVCTLGEGGALTCAGDDSHGQLGDRHRTTQGVPEPVPGLTDVASLGGGSTSMCATRADQSVWCWGTNDGGQLGDGTKTPRQVPTLAAVVSGVTQVVMGDNFACGLAKDGTVVCWGQNGSGELGDGTLLSRVLPRPVLIGAAVALTGVARITASATHACALTVDQRVYCWGGNNVGEAGVDLTVATAVKLATPVAVPSAAKPQPVLDLTAGSSHTCAITQDHEVWCWGWGDHNRLAVTLTAPATSTSIPVDTGVGGADQLSSHDGFTCARALADGTLQCWGEDGNGQLGDGSANEGGTIKVSVLSNVASVAASSQHACAVSSKDGGVSCWGAGSRGQVGDNGYTGRFSARPVVNLTGVTSLATTDLSTCALLADHTVACWGEGRDGELGDGARQSNTLVTPLLPCP